MCLSNSVSQSPLWGVFLVRHHISSLILATLKGYVSFLFFICTFLHYALGMINNLVAKFSWLWNQQMTHPSSLVQVYCFSLILYGHLAVIFPIIWCKVFVVLLLVGFFKHLITPEFMCAEKQRLIDCSTRHIACGHLDGVDGNHLVFFFYFYAHCLFPQWWSLFSFWSFFGSALLEFVKMHCQ